MGDRGQVRVKDGWAEGYVYLYTHWGAYRLVQSVQRAMAKRWRWNDSCYLARIIFDEMKRLGESEKIGYQPEQAMCDVGETGYGICTARHGDTRIEVQVDAENKKVTVVSPGWALGMEEKVEEQPPDKII